MLSYNAEDDWTEKYFDNSIIRFLSSPADIELIISRILDFISSAALFVKVTANIFLK